ncbi:RING-H2 finger protein [Actinidia chinensis var. chinensis]|uniref:RING-type E3 ubiquitin transferase n=1 Tax=Actinidia chinensis var. chinensis TaxID=1590841 RepID=A0A2R6RNP4_ACTCC|nr:RING-H2 finger protein [Actinidia chinensis var. chinensis]
MATKHRKLFPIATNVTNQTDCLYGSYPYYDYFLLPPPPPPPPPLSTHQAQQVSSYLIIIFSFLAISFLLLAFYIFIIKSCSRRNRSPTQSNGQDQEDFLDENQGPAIEHPIWYIRSVGLQPSVIRSITVFKYQKGDSLIEGSECSVCLNEFQEDDTLRLLPKCNHAFHIPCIDTWLASHTNCPLCRAGILSNTWGASSAPIPIEQNSSGVAPEVETQIENSENDGQLGENRIAETEGDVELVHVDDEGKEIDDSKDTVNSNVNSISSDFGNLEDEKMAMEGDIEPVMRSNSMDSSPVAKFQMAESEGDSEKSELGIVQTQDRLNSRIDRMMGGSSIEQSLHKSPVSMKRSFSYGGRLFLPRHSRNSSSILPL